MKKLLVVIMGLIACVHYSYATMELSLNISGRNNVRCTYAEATNTYTITGSGKNAYVPIDALSRNLNAKEMKLVFEYCSVGGVANLTLSYGDTFKEVRTISYGTLSPTGTSEYKPFSVDMSSDICAFKWGKEGQVFRLGIGADERVKIRNLRIEEIEPNVQGKITCSSVGVEDVIVSDGYTFARTNENGEYSLYSNKKNGYIFYVIPSGYMPKTTSSSSNDERIFTRFWKYLSKTNDLKAVETVNFELMVENNNDFRMLVGADPQMANKNNDVNTFRTLFFPCTEKEVKEANEANVPIYSTYMGDLAWDNYWYSRSWGHTQYKNVFIQNYSKYKMRHFSVMGNHDHDGAIYNSDSVDFMSAHSFRENLGPNYYSYNIGKIHFLVMDDIIYKNEDTGGSYAKGIVGSRNYTEGFSDTQVNWAKKDLAMLDADATVIMSMHAPMYKIGSIAHNTISNGLLNYDQMESLLSRFKQVHIWSGHRHLTYNMNPVACPRIMEHTINQMGGDLYAASYYSGLYSPSPQGVGRPVSADGTPGSYQMFYFYGDSITWRFKGLEKDNNGQFHVFDGNSIRNFWQTDATMKAICAESEELNTYASLEDNAIIVNVFNYDTKWKVEVFEGTSTKSLDVSSYQCRDIYHILAYEYNYYKKNKSVPSITANHYHTFKAVAKNATTSITVRVTDRFGNKYERTITRPQTVTLNNLAVGENKETIILTGIDKQKAEFVNDMDVRCVGSYIVIKKQSAGMAQITSIDGTTRTVGLSEGVNKIPAPQKGINIVTMNGKSLKLFVR